MLRGVFHKNVQEDPQEFLGQLLDRDEAPRVSAAFFLDMQDEKECTACHYRWSGADPKICWNVAIRDDDMNEMKTIQEAVDKEMAE